MTHDRKLSGDLERKIDAYAKTLDVHGRVEQLSATNVDRMNDSILRLKSAITGLYRLSDKINGVGSDDEDKKNTMEHQYHDIRSILTSTPDALKVLAEEIDDLVDQIDKDLHINHKQ